MGWNYVSIPKLQWLHRWSLGMDKSFRPIFHSLCNCLFMSEILGNTSQYSIHDLHRICRNAIEINHWNVFEYHTLKNPMSRVSPSMGPGKKNQAKYCINKHLFYFANSKTNNLEITCNIIVFIAISLKVKYQGPSLVLVFISSNLLDITVISVWRRIGMGCYLVSNITVTS